MNNNPPTPPAELPTDLVDTLDRYSPAQLRDVANYAGALAEHKERAPSTEDESSEADTDVDPDDRPDDVPTKATLTVKEINENRYYYWQWREGDSVTSKYKGPVGAEE